MAGRKNSRGAPRSKAADAESQCSVMGATEAPIDPSEFAAAKLNLVLGAGLDSSLPKLAMRIVAVFVGRYMIADRGGAAWPAVSTLCDDLSISRSSDKEVRDALNHLVARGHLVKDSEAGKARGTTNRYRISDRYFAPTGSGAMPPTGSGAMPPTGSGAMPPTSTGKESPGIDLRGAVAAEARHSAPSTAPSQGAVVERLGVTSEAQESPRRIDSLPSPAGSLSRLPARSPAEEGPFSGSEAARYESLDPGPAYVGDVLEIGDPETA
jgi:hypothetical protein